MNDPDVRLGWTILRALPQDESSFNAVQAVHSLVWELWRLRDELAQAREAVLTGEDRVPLLPGNALEAVSELAAMLTDEEKDSFISAVSRTCPTCRTDE